MRVLSVGEDPATVDYSKTPEGVDEAYIRKGLEQASAEMAARGWEVRMCLVPPQVRGAVAAFGEALAGGPFDVILMGGGLRMPPDRVQVSEALANEARRCAPDAALAFDNDPKEGPEAVARQVGAAGA